MEEGGGMREPRPRIWAGDPRRWELSMGAGEEGAENEVDEEVIRGELL